MMIHYSIEQLIFHQQCRVTTAAGELVQGNGKYFTLVVLAKLQSKQNDIC